MPTLQRAATRPYRTLVVDSGRWSGFAIRPDDIVIATYAKCGTTWMQRIVDLLVFQNPEPRPVQETSVWLDSRIFGPLAENTARLEAQTHRRFIKSHLPFDSLPIYDDVKYIHVARDGRDAFMSWHNHVSGFTAEAGARIAAIAAEDPAVAGGGRPTGPPPEPQIFFQGWIAEAEAEPSVGPGENLSFFDFETTYWTERHRPNLLMVHYNDLKADLAGEMRRIGEFLEIGTPADRLAVLAEAAGFDAMKAAGSELLGEGVGVMFDRGADRFLNKGTNGRWKDVLTDADLARYDAVVMRKFSPALAAWIEHGRRGGDPATMPD